MSSKVDAERLSNDYATNNYFECEGVGSFAEEL
jgi:hypothetical protein